MLAALVLAGIVVFRMRGQAFDWKLFFDTLRSVDLRWLSVAILLLLLTYAGRALRWEVMLRPLGRRVSLARLTSDTFIGFMAATILGRLGEFVRPYLISVSAGATFSSQVAAWLLERLLDLLAVLLLFGVALIAVPSQGLPIGPGLRWTLSVGGYVAALAGLLCIILLVAFRSFGDTAQARILAALTFLPASSQERCKQLLAAFSRGVEATRNGGLLWELVCYTAVEWALIVGAYVAFFQAFSTTRRLTIPDVITFSGFTAFGSILQIPGLGGGFQITAIAVLHEIFGLTLESASGISLFLWALVAALVVSVGIVCALRQGLNFNRIKQLAASHSGGELS